jgi:uncharacterized protein YjbI with pentapeptide repeats
VASNIKAIQSCHLDRCDLSGARFPAQSHIAQTSFQKCNLRGADFTGVSISSATCFDESDLTEARFGGHLSHNVSFSRATLVRASFASVVFGDVVFDGADLTNVDLSQKDLQRVSLKGAVLVLANLSRAKLEGTLLNGANLSDADLQEATLSNFPMLPSRLSRRGNSRIPAKADRQCASLKGARLSRANLSRANLGGVNLEGADLTGAALIETDLREADLRNVTGLVQSNLVNFKVVTTGALFTFPVSPTSLASMPAFPDPVGSSPFDTPRTSCDSATTLPWGAPVAPGVGRPTSEAAAVPGGPAQPGPLSGGGGTPNPFGSPAAGFPAPSSGSRGSFTFPSVFPAFPAMPQTGGTFPGTSAGFAARK